MEFRSLRIMSYFLPHLFSEQFQNRALKSGLRWSCFHPSWIFSYRG